MVQKWADNGPFRIFVLKRIRFCGGKIHENSWHKKLVRAWQGPGSSACYPTANSHYRSTTSYHHTPEHTDTNRDYEHDPGAIESPSIGTRRECKRTR